MTGYAHSRYAESLAEFGTPRELPRSGGWLLERPVPGFPYRDAMGCYPLFSCRDWSQLHADLEELSDDLVSVSLVPEPFGGYDRACLEQSFELVVAFKDACVIDLGRSPTDFVSRHHQRDARRALARLTVEEHQAPGEFLDEFLRLHKTLVARHSIAGIRAFSRRAFALQLSTPGAVLLRAMCDGVNVGAQLWFVQGEVAYGHVLAFSEEGYRLGAPYALYWFAIQYFAERRLRWCSVGGMPSTPDRSTEGLEFFKRGWSRETRPTYFCGRVCNRERYEEIVRAKGTPETGYFPAYRRGEFF